jgi:prepilin-type N-terminal cleavage/methylation domain-containing protein
MRLRSQSTGFTLVECSLASAVLAIAVLAFCVAVTSGHMQSAHAVRAEQAKRLAEELMEFALRLPYFDPQGGGVLGPDPGELGLLNYDNIDDLHGYEQQPGGLKGVGQNLHPDAYQMFGRGVTVEYATETVSDLGGSLPGLTVTVWVDDSKACAYTITRFVPEPVY